MSDEDLSYQERRDRAINQQLDRLESDINRQAQKNLERAKAQGRPVIDPLIKEAMDRLYKNIFLPAVQKAGGSEEKIDSYLDGDSAKATKKTRTTAVDLPPYIPEEPASSDVLLDAANRAKYKQRRQEDNSFDE